MAYFLGRDVSVVLKADHPTRGILATGLIDSDGSGGFATDSALAGDAVTDLTGLDVGIGVTDEDITYMGKKSVLKAEIKKETTCSMTRKKSNSVWEKVFNNARWGAATGDVLHDGLTEPPADGTALGSANYGYIIVVTMNAASDTLTLAQCTITGHTISLNADGTTEETLEFITQVAPVVS